MGRHDMGFTEDPPTDIFLPAWRPEDTEPLEFSVIGPCYRCQHLVGWWEGRLLDTSWDEEMCYPHDDPDRTHLTRGMVIQLAMAADADRPIAVWNALAALVRAERVPSGLRGSHIKSASRALASGRCEA